MIDDNNTNKNASDGVIIDANNVPQQQPPIPPRDRRTYEPWKNGGVPVAKNEPNDADPPFVDHWDSSATAKPRPEWYWKIKSARPWMIVHVEHGPPKPRPMSREPAPGEEEQPPPATVGQADLIDSVTSEPQAPSSKTSG